MAARKKTVTKRTARFNNGSNPSPSGTAKDSKQTSITKGAKGSPATPPKKST